MKKARRWTLSLITKVLTVILIIMLLPYAKPLFSFILPDTTGEIRVQSAVLHQKLEASKKLEVTSVDETGIMEAETNVIIFGTVGKTTIRYRYTASIGIDLSKVIMTEDSDRIIFLLPETEVLNDGIEALEINRQDLFSKAIDKSIETLMSDQRLQCREQYLTGDPLFRIQSANGSIRSEKGIICLNLSVRIRPGPCKRPFSFSLHFLQTGRFCSP